MAGDGAATGAGPTAPVVDAREARGIQVGSHGRQTNIEVHGPYYATSLPVQWPVLVSRPPLLADAFQARPGLVEIGPGADPGSSMITHVLTGGGGTGKTQLAASLYRQALPGMQVAVWASATSRSAVLAAYTRAWHMLHPGLPNSGDAEQDAMAFVAWL